MKQVSLGFVPRAFQEKSLRELKRFSVLVIHRRAGKTVLAVMKLLDAALRYKGTMGRYGYLAPQLKQAKGIAWEYLKHYGMKVPGAFTNEAELYIQFTNGARVRIYGADNPDSLRGLYFDGLVLDEVGQMKRETWSEVLRPAVADRGGWCLFIGTPKGVNLFSEVWFGALKSGGEWYTALWKWQDTKTLPVAEVEAMRASMTERQFRQEMECDFSASGDDCLISVDEAQAAAGRRAPAAEFDFAPRVLGVDVAWTGGDRCVAFRRQGLVAYPPDVAAGLPEKAYAVRVAHMIQEWKPVVTFVDTTGGYGGELVSRLRDAGFGVQGVVFSWKASNPRFANIRAEMWFRMAEWVKGGGCIPNDPGLIAELCAPSYSNDNAGNRLTLESKDAVKERLGCSPDLADALGLTFAMPVASRMPFGMPGAAGVVSAWDLHQPHGEDTGQLETEYDLFAD